MLNIKMFVKIKCIAAIIASFCKVNFMTTFFGSLEQNQ